MKRILGLWPLVLLLGLQFLFWQKPELDLWFSGLFWSETSGFHFSELPPVQWSYALFRDMPYVLVPALLWLLLASWLWARRRETDLRRALLFLLLVLAVGPGLLVNEVFKAESGRARPSQVEDFGGQSVFSPAFEPSDQCHSNCSFVSGHAAMGFFFLAFAWVLRDRRWLYWGAAIGLLVGLGRIVQGAHFLSDVLFGYPVVLATAFVFARLLLGRWRIIA